MNAATKLGESHFWKRVGIAGFAFFLLKGLIWLSVPIIAYLLDTAH